MTVLDVTVQGVMVLSVMVLGVMVLGMMVPFVMVPAVIVPAVMVLDISSHTYCCCHLLTTWCVHSPSRSHTVPCLPP